jgi:hypothetical protein
VGNADSRHAPASVARHVMTYFLMHHSYACITITCTRGRSAPRAALKCAFAHTRMGCPMIEFVGAPLVETGPTKG